MAIKNKIFFFIKKYIYKDFPERLLPPFGEKRIYKILLRDGNKCHYCGKKLKIGIKYQNHKNQATIDHVIPKSKGGNDDINNCVLSCSNCNIIKDDKILSKKEYIYFSNYSKINDLIKNSIIDYKQKRNMRSLSCKEIRILSTKISKDILNIVE